jgi:hypothetical protein
VRAVVKKTKTLKRCLENRCRRGLEKKKKRERQNLYRVSNTKKERNRGNDGRGNKTKGCDGSTMLWE